MKSFVLTIVLQCVIAAIIFVRLILLHAIIRNRRGSAAIVVLFVETIYDDRSIISRFMNKVGMYA